MILSSNPNQPEDFGLPLPLPRLWLDRIVPWAVSGYRVYDFGSTLIQEFVNPELGVFIWTLEIEKPVSLYRLAPTPRIAFQFALEGGISGELKGSEQMLLEKGSCGMFYFPPGAGETWFQPGTYETLFIELQPVYFERLIAIRPEFAALVTAVENSSPVGIPMAVVRINYITRTILQNLKSCTKKGASLQLEFHKYILELLSEYFTALSPNKNRLAELSVRYKTKMETIRDHILFEPNVHNQTRGKLARYFGISESVLKREFKRHFKISVSRFVRQHAMRKSHYLLETTAKSIEEISEEVGYSWRPAFEESFKKFFKYTPSKVRKDLNP